MLCQSCHKNLSTVRYAEVVDGHVTDRRLCADCLAKLQADANAGFEISGSAPKLNESPSAREARDSVSRRKSCPHCGAVLRDILDSRQVGCSRCYDQFGGQIESLLEGLHASLRHKGKICHLEDTRARVRADLQAKRALLRSMLRAENYEEAARLRDEVRSLETGLCVSESGAD